MLLKKGSKGNAVKEVQRVLGLTPDGIFGSYTEAAVKKYQRARGLTADGIVGPKTYEMMISKDDIDTDRFGYDDSNDTDNKLEYLGSYDCACDDGCGLKIDRAYLDSDEYVRDYGKIEPINLVIHHTAGWNNPYNTINSWNRDSRGRVATQYVLGGTSIKKGKYGDDKYNGVVVECFPDNYLGWHMGKVGSFEKMSKLAVGIEINNFGYAEKKGEKFYNYVDVEVPKEMVCDLGYEFRGHRYWHDYTDEQIESLGKLIQHIHKIYPKINLANGIPKRLKNGMSPREAFEFNADAYYGKELGVWSHTSARKDKFDVYPHPKLVELLKSLA
jgi:hypothetical protein